MLRERRPWNFMLDFCHSNVLVFLLAPIMCPEAETPAEGLFSLSGPRDADTSGDLADTVKGCRHG